MPILISILKEEKIAIIYCALIKYNFLNVVASHMENCSTPLFTERKLELRDLHHFVDA